MGVNYSKLTDCIQIFWNTFVCLHHHLCKISAQINEWNIFCSLWFPTMNSLQHYLLFAASTTLPTLCLLYNTTYSVPPLQHYLLCAASTTPPTLCRLYNTTYSVPPLYAIAAASVKRDRDWHKNNKHIMDLLLHKGNFYLTSKINWKLLTELPSQL